ncbi:MAG: hypothetical protein WD768_22415 [Phycisphaeraceae bacterium]
MSNHFAITRRRADFLLIAVAGCLLFAQTPARAAETAPAPEPADAGIGRRTAFSRDAVLKKRDLAGLPAIGERGKGDASKAFAALLKYYDDNRKAIDPEGSAAEVGEKVIDLFLAIQTAGEVPGKTMDDMVPMQPQARPKFGAALLELTLVAMHRAAVIHNRANAQSKARALGVAQAIWELGQSMFENSERVQLRTMGLELMRAGGTELYNWSADGTKLGDAILKWVNAMNDFDNEYWGPKCEVLSTLLYGEAQSPALADLTHTALNDEDLSWRIAATLELGRVKYSKRTPAQDRAMQAVIQTLMKDKNEKVAAAAKAAHEFTKEQVRDLGK